MRHFHFFRMIGPATICFLGWSSAASFGQASSSAGAGASASASGSAQGSRTQQQTNANGGAEAQAGANGSGASTSANGAADGSAPVAMSQVPAELVTKLDSKTAKAGDVVEAKTTKTVKTADGTVIQKGSKLMGTVTQAQAHAKGQSASMLALNFDRLQPKGGPERMLRSSIDSVSSPAGLSAAGEGGGDELIAAGPVSSGGGGGARGGLGAGGLGAGAGGLVGGAAGGASSTLNRTGGGLGNSVQSAGGTVQGAGGQARGAAQGLTNTVNGSVSGAVQQGDGVVARATDLPGVLLRSSAAEGTSGVLSAAGKNVHLDSGTRMVLSIAAQK